MSKTKSTHKTSLRKSTARQAPLRPGGGASKKNTASINPSGISSWLGQGRRRNLLLGLILLVVVGVIITIAVQVTHQSPATAQLTPLPKNVFPALANQKYEAGAFFLDVREQSEWDAGHIPNSTLIPLEELTSRLDEIPRDKDIIVVCRTGNRSQQARDILLQLGFDSVASMDGGVTAWANAGYPFQGTIP